MTEIFAGDGVRRPWSDTIKSFLKTSELLNILSGIGALLAFLTDTLQSRFPHCTRWVFLGVLFVMGATWALAKTGHIRRETSDRVLSSLFVPSAVLFAMLIWQMIAGDPKEGVIVTKIEEIRTDVHAVKKDAQESNDQLRKLTPQMREVVNEVHEIKNIPANILAQLLPRIEKLAPANEDKGTVRAMLMALAEQYKALQYELAKDNTGEPRARALLDQAESDFSRGDFELARLKIRQAAEIDRDQATSLTNRATENTVAAVAALEHSAHLAELAGHRLEAGEDYAEAAKLIAAIDPHRAWQLTRARAGEIRDDGVERHDPAAVNNAITVYRGAMTMVPKGSEDWQVSRNELGVALPGSSARIAGSTMDLSDGGDGAVKSRGARSARSFDGLRSPATHRRRVSGHSETPAVGAGPVVEQPAAPKAEPEHGGLLSRFKDWFGGSSKAHESEDEQGHASVAQQRNFVQGRNAAEPRSAPSRGVGNRNRRHSNDR